MPDDNKVNTDHIASDERVSVVLTRARKLSLELTKTVAELSDLLQNYGKEVPNGN